MTRPACRPAVAGDWPAVRELLAAAKLPTGDLGPASMPSFIVATAGDGIVGAIGLEADGEAGLLRSLVVAGDRRGAGLGRLLLAELEASAQARGVRELWLLTIDAGGFFEAAGYVRRGRDDAPGSIRASREFGELCPASASLYSRRLQDD